MGGTQILHDFLLDDIGLNGEIRLNFQTFLQVSSSTFAILIYLIGPIIKKENKFP